jgi:oxaloacetate decarboxylase beta subunit
MDKINILWQSTALPHFTTGQIIMMAVGLVLLYLAIVKKFEPLLLFPIGFGALLTNIPLAGFSEVGGLLHYIYAVGIEQVCFHYSFLWG